jgi:hypothetical protein
MSFATTTTRPSTSSKVTIKFVGLMLLKPGAGNTCEIGIHRLSDTHSFQAMVIVNKPCRTPSLIRLVTGPLTGPFAINVTPDPGTGVQAFTSTSTAFDRANYRNNNLDFRWALNLQQEQGITMDFNNGARPSATLNAGVLYTPSLVGEELNTELVRGTTRKRLNRLSADLAAAINLPEGGRVELTWDEDGEPREYRLPRRVDRHEPETTYTVLLLNDRHTTNLLTITTCWNTREPR